MKRFIFVLALALVAAACGDSSGSNSASGADFCESSDVFDSFEPDFSTADSLKVSFESLNDVLQGYASSAPSEIEDDVKFVAGAFGDLISELAAVDYDFAQIESIMTNFDDPELEAAGDRISDYVEAECGLEDSSGEGSSSAALSDDSSESSDGDSNDDASESADGNTDTASDLSGEIPDSVVDSVASSLGIAPESVECLLDLSGNMDASGMLDDLQGMEALQLLEDCNIDLAAIAGGLGGMLDETTDDSDDLTSDDAFDSEADDMFISIMADLWNTEDENIYCLMDKAGVDDAMELGSAAANSDFFNFLEECGIDLDAVLGSS